MPAAAMTSGRRSGRARLAAARPEAEAEHHRADDGADVGLEEVRAHARDVADVVADVVRDDGRVAGVVLGETRLDLADEVGADVGGLGVDAAADTREQRDRAGAHREAGHDVDRDRELRQPAGHGVAARVGRREQARVRVEEVETAEAEDGQADDRHAHHGAAAERDVERLRQPGARRVGRAHVGVGRHAHADEAREARRERASHEGHRDPPAAALAAHVRDGELRLLRRLNKRSRLLVLSSRAATSCLSA